MEITAENRVTVVDIARKAGVCQATVSAALHGRGRVGAARRRQIEAIARELGYEPRSAAQLLRATKTNQLGIVVAATDAVRAFAREVQRLVMGHFVQQCDLRGVRYVIEFHHHQQDEQGEFVPPHQITSRLVDGTILVGDVGERLRQWLGERSECAWVSIEEEAPLCVLSASEQGTDQAVGQLAELGHRRLAYAGGPERYSQQRLGLEGFLAASRQRSLEYTLGRFAGVVGADVAGECLQWARSLLCQANRPTAVVCHGEDLARSVCYAAAELGLKVPADLSVVSYGSAAEAARRYPRLTTIENDYAKVTAQAMDLLHWRMTKQPIEQPVRRVSPRLIEGDTVGAVPAVIKSVRP